MTKELTEAEKLEAELNGGTVVADAQDAGAAPKADDKAAATAAAQPTADEDPEIDLGGTLGKVKRSQIEGWKKNGMLEEDYRKKTEDLAAQQKQLEALSNMSDYLGKNPKKLAKVLQILEDADDAQAAAAAGTGTQAAAQAAGDAAKDAISAILEKMDPEDPASVLLKEIYTELKSVRATVKGFEDRETKLQEQQRLAEEARAADANKEIFENTRKLIATNLDSELEGHKFESDIEKQIWRDQAIKALQVAGKQGFKSEEDLVKAIKAASSAAAQSVKAIGEARLKKHFEQKGPILPGPGASGDVAPKTVTMENLQDILEGELSKRNAETK